MLLGIDVIAGQLKKIDEEIGSELNKAIKSAEDAPHAHSAIAAENVYR